MALFGMNPRDLKTLKRLMTVHPSAGQMCETVEEYIKNHAIKTETWISHTGTEMVRVFYPTGRVKDYPKSQIGRATAFEY